MTLNDDGGAPARRRRGAALEDALLEATWAELTEVGYGAFTIESVAARAGTSRAVLYRRWPTKGDLVWAAMVRKGASKPAPVPDTGSLREDVVGFLVGMNERRIRLAMEVMPQLGEYFHATGTSLEELRQSIFGEHTAMHTIVEHAVARGEIDADAATDRITKLPMDLCRHEVLMTYAPVPTSVIEEIVDTIFLPLVLTSRPPR